MVDLCTGYHDNDVTLTQGCVKEFALHTTYSGITLEINTWSTQDTQHQIVSKRVRAWIDFHAIGYDRICEGYWNKNKSSP